MYVHVTARAKMSAVFLFVLSEAAKSLRASGVNIVLFAQIFCKYFISYLHALVITMIHSLYSLV